MAPSDVEQDVASADERYRESSDEDFNPAAAPPEPGSSSEDEDEQVAATAVPRRGKRKAPPDEELDSGDEVTIQAARKKRARKSKKGAKDDGHELLLSEDEGGDGGLVKTRAQRRGEQKEPRPLARTEGATVDVDALWAQLITAPLQPLRPTLSQETHVPAHDAPTATAPPPTQEEYQIPIRKIYTFAGQDTTEEKSIPRSHLPKYISDGWKPLDSTTPPPPTPGQPAAPATSKFRRPLRRPTRFDPNPTGHVRALPPEHQLFWPRQHTSTSPARGQETPLAPPDAPTARPQKATRLNVVDKSRMDWTGFVDKEGIAEELDTHGKTKEAYLGRMEFLAGVEARREEGRLNAKMKGASAAAVS